MATYFIYPTDGPETYASVDSGSVASGSVAQGGGVYTSSSSKVTSDEQLIDGNLSTAANFTEQHATIRVDKGSGSIDKIDSAAYYFTNTASDNATTTTQATIAATVLGWNVDATMTIGNSKRFWYMSAHEEAVATVTQVILGTKLSLTNVGLSGTEGVIHENTMITSQGGVEYSNKKHDGKKFWSLSLKFVSSA